MATYDVGDVVYLTWNTVDSSGTAVNPGTVTLSITLPDATNVSVTTATSVTGTYTANYTPTQVGRYIYAFAATGTWPQAYNDLFEVRDIKDIGIVSLDEVKAHINYPSSITTDDSELLRFVDAGIEMAENYCGFVLGRQTFTNEAHDGQDVFVRLRYPKAISITSVVESGVTLASTQYFLDYTGQRLFRIGSASWNGTNAYGLWAPGLQNIVITYVSGFVKPPAVARQGTLEIIKHLWETQRGSKSVIGKATDEYQQGVTYSMPRRVCELLDQIALPGIA